MPVADTLDAVGISQSIRTALIGAGPRGTSALERLLANWIPAGPDATLHIDVIDPYPAGPGHVWQPGQSRLYLMNTQSFYPTVIPEDPDLAPPRAGHTFDLDHTRPALDLTMLFNGFQPLLQLLDPQDVNNLSGQIVAVFQGEDATVDGLLSSTASLTSTLAEKDEVIGQLITSLSSVLQVVNDRSGQLDTTIVTLQQLVSGLADDRKTIGSTLDGLGELTTSVAGLLEDGRAPLKGSITALDQLAGNLSKAEPQLDSFFEQLPTKLDRIGRTGSYGSWINFYACSIEGKIPRPEGYYGALGAQPIAQRCR